VFSLWRERDEKEADVARRRRNQVASLTGPVGVRAGVVWMCAATQAS